MIQYIWIEGEQALKSFCQKRFKQENIHWMETIGHIGGATIENIWKLDTERRKCIDMYLLYMEHPNGDIYEGELNDIRRMTYEQIRANKHFILNGGRGSVH